MTIFLIALYSTALIYCFSVLYLLRGLFNLNYTENSKLHKFSIIIAVHNEEKNIEACLNGIFAQSYPHDKFEVIIADDRSTDNTIKLIKQYSERYENLKVVTVQPNESAVPKKTALFKALNSATGEIILSTDGDCIQPPGWVSSINRCFTVKVGMVIGRAAYFMPKNIWQGVDSLDYLTLGALGAAFAGVGSVYTCTAANMAYRKEIFDKNREGFRNLKIRPAEDNYILHQVKNANLQIVVATHAHSVIETKGADNFSHYLNQRFRWSAYGGNITSPGVKLFFIPALLFYIIIGSSLFASIIFPQLLIPLGITILGKMIADFCLVLKYTSIYKCKYLLKYFVPLSLIHLFVAPLTVIKGNLFSFKWKDKRYTKTKEV